MRTSEGPAKLGSVCWPQMLCANRLWTDGTSTCQEGFHLIVTGRPNTKSAIKEFLILLPPPPRCWGVHQALTTTPDRNFTCLSAFFVLHFVVIFCVFLNSFIQCILTTATPSSPLPSLYLPTHPFIPSYLHSLCPLSFWSSIKSSQYCRLDG